MKITARTFVIGRPRSSESYELARSNVNQIKYGNKAVYVKITIVTN